MAKEEQPQCLRTADVAKAHPFPLNALWIGFSPGFICKMLPTTELRYDLLSITYL